MGRLRWVTSLLILTGLGPALAQVTYPNCSSGWEWSYNSLSQNPCNVAAYLESVCNGGQFNIPQLPPGRMYAGPTAAQFYPCECNTVVYSLISACAACQGSNGILWSAWSINCSTVGNSTYPESIPNGTRVPYWAYLDLADDSSWNATAAQSAGDSPEVTPSAPSTIQPSSTASAAPKSTSGSNQNQNKSHSNTGAIAGAVVGAIVGVALLTASMLWYRRRRRLRTEAQPSPFAEKSQAFGLPDSDASMSNAKYYDPSDPSTFPKPFVSPSESVIQTTASTDQAHSIATRPSDRSRYQGLPLV